MVRSVIFGLIIVLLLVVFIIARFFFSNTSFPDKVKHLYIRTGQVDKEKIMESLRRDRLISNPGSFEFLASQMDVWENVRPGKYAVKKGTSLFELARMLRNGKQAPVNLVITKIRTKESLAQLIGRKFETDSATMLAFLNNVAGLRQYGLDTNSVMTAVFPNTYTYFWTSSPAVIFRKLKAEHDRVWNEHRRRKADSLGLNTTTAYILASIIEEETNYNPEKGLMASVYLNRLNKDMNLGADPTVKFALRDFGLKRIYEKHLLTESPYNTYRHRGLPPGPICTPSLRTLDEVLNAPKTDYLFFVAKKDFTPGHVFTSNYQDHLRYAREYQRALSAQEQLRQKVAREEIGE